MAVTADGIFAWRGAHEKMPNLKETVEETVRQCQQEVILAAHRQGPLCRDCADNNGRCPNSGELCDPYEAALEKLQQDKLRP